MSTVAVNTLQAQRACPSPLMPTVGRFSYYTVEKTTRLNHPHWAALIKKIYDIANFFIHGLNYLHACIWRPPLQEQAHDITPSAEKLPKKIEQETTLPVPTAETIGFVPIQEAGDLEAALEKDLAEEEAQRVGKGTTEKLALKKQELTVTPAVTAAEMSLLKEWYLAILITEYIKEQTTQQKTPAEEDLTKVFSPLAIQTLFEQVEQCVARATPEEIKALKEKLHEALNAPEQPEDVVSPKKEQASSSNAQNSIAMGCGIAAGCSIGLLNVLLGNYLSQIGLKMAGSIFSSWMPQSLTSMSSVTNGAKTMLLGGLQGLVIKQKVFAYLGVVGLSLPLLNGFTSLFNPSKPTLEKAADLGLATTAAAILARLSYPQAAEIKLCIQDQQHAFSSGGADLLKRGLTHLTAQVKNCVLDRMLPQHISPSGRASFEKGYKVGVLASLVSTTASLVSTAASSAYIIATATGVTPWISTPLALMAGVGAGMFMTTKEEIKK